MSESGFTYLPSHTQGYASVAHCQSSIESLSRQEDMARSNLQACRRTRGMSFDCSCRVILAVGTLSRQGSTETSSVANLAVMGKSAPPGCPWHAVSALACSAIHLLVKCRPRLWTREHKKCPLPNHLVIWKVAVLTVTTMTVCMVSEACYASSALAWSVILGLVECRQGTCKRPHRGEPCTTSWWT